MFLVLYWKLSSVKKPTASITVSNFQIQIFSSCHGVTHRNVEWGAKKCSPLWGTGGDTEFPYVKTREGFSLHKALLIYPLRYCDWWYLDEKCPLNVVQAWQGVYSGNSFHCFSVTELCIASNQTYRHHNHIFLENMNVCKSKVYHLNRIAHLLV